LELGGGYELVGSDARPQPERAVVAVEIVWCELSAFGTAGVDGRTAGGQMKVGQGRIDEIRIGEQGMGIFARAGLVGGEAVVLLRVPPENRVVGTGFGVP
jgi:hypothetical protein